MKYCCGCSLKTGTIIVGVINAIGAIINMVQGILALTAEEVIDKPPSIEINIVNSAASNIDVNMLANYSVAKDFMEVVVLILVVVGGIAIVIVLGLIAGAIYEKPILLIPWMAYVPIYMLANIVLYVMCGYAYFIISMIVEGVVCVLAAVAHFSLALYFIVVVVNFYILLKGVP